MIWAMVVGALTAMLPVSAVIAQPELAVPFRASAPTIDGRAGFGEWQGAAVVRNLWLPGNLRLLAQPTEFLLQYNADCLFVAALCHESEAGYPHAFPRQPTDLLTDDDAVQVVLGTADEHVVSRDVLNMGGYEHALGQPVSAADHYYQFTVNAAGAASRTYNEGPLQRPLFEAAVGRGRGRWIVEMRIPFASAGVGDPTRAHLFLNLFRFRPPEMAAWHLPAFGGYAPMPFGRLHLLSLNQAGRRTVQEPPQAPASVPVTQDTGVHARLEWFPLSRRVVAQISNHTSGAVTASLRAPGLQERSDTVSGATAGRLILEVPRSASLPVTAEVVVCDTGGTVLARESLELTPVAEPEWLGTDVASEYVRDRVPWPWTRPQVSADTVQLQHGSLRFGGSGLFRSVQVGGAELLAAEGEVIVQVDGRRLLLQPGRLRITRFGNEVVVFGSSRVANGRVDLRSVVEFDGFTTCKLRVRGLRPQSIEKLAVQWPVRKDNARFVLRLLVQDIRQLTGFGWEGPGGPVWLGGHERGLAFDSDTPLFLSTRRRSQVQVVEQNDRAWLRINLVDGAGQVTQDGHVFRFFVQPTPTRQVSLKKEGLHHTSMWFEEWSDYQGYPDLAKLPEVKRRAGEAHARGMPFVLYFSQMLAENAPGFQQFRREFIVPPGLMWYQRAYEPGLNVPCWVCCPRGPYGDLLLHGMDRLAREGGVDGVYMDGTTVPWECTNPSHPACDGTAVVSWSDDVPTPLVTTRNFLKRVRGVFDRHGRPWLFAHTGGAINIATLSLCDGFYEGEQLARYRPGYRIPLHQFAVGYCGIPWGFRTDCLSHSYGARRMMTFAALHDTEVGGEVGELERRIYNDFQDDATVEYHPYWRPQPHARRLAGEVVFSYYRKPEAAMLIVSNLTWTPQDAVLDVSGLWAGGEVHAEDVDAQEPLPVDAGRLRLSIQPHRFRAVRVQPGPQTVALPEPAPEAVPAQWRVEGFQARDWDLHPTAPGVTVTPDWDLGNGHRGVKLTSKLYHDYATATFTAHPVSANCSFRLVVHHHARFQIDIGSWCLQWDGQRWHLPTDPWREGMVYQPRVSDAPHELVLSLREGRLDAVLAGQALARDVPVENLGPNSFLSLRTWSDEWMAFTLLEACSAPMRLFEESVRHPVL